MKKLLTSFLGAIALVTQACWFTQDNFESNYIAGCNNPFQAHYTAASSTSVANARYYNGMQVAMPITVYVKVGPRFPDQTGETEGQKPVLKAILQYKILPGGEWVTVRTIENVSWPLEWSHPVALFGKNSINIDGISAGTEILIRLYLSDGTFETGSLSTDITSTVPDTASKASGGLYEGGWSAPFVMRVIWNGKWRAK